MEAEPVPTTLKADDTDAAAGSNEVMVTDDLDKDRPMRREGGKHMLGLRRESGEEVKQTTLSYCYWYFSISIFCHHRVVNILNGCSSP